VRPPGVSRHDGVHDAVDTAEVREADVQGALATEDANRVGGSEPVCFAGLGSSGSGFTMQRAPQKCEPEGELYLSLQLRWIGPAMARYTVPEQRPSRTEDHDVSISMVL